MAVTPQLWWYVARASGIVAWSLAAASVLLGLALSSRVLGTRPRGPWLLDLHRFLGALTVVFTGVHLTGLVADTYTHWGPSDLLVPFATSWRPAATALGIVAAYLLVAIEGTSLAMKRLPKRLWRAVHMTSFGLYVFATGHLLTAGTDRHNPVLLGVVVASTLAVVFGTVYRIAAKRPKRSLPARQKPVTGARGSPKALQEAGSASR